MKKIPKYLDYCKSFAKEELESCAGTSVYVDNLAATLTLGVLTNNRLPICDTERDSMDVVSAWIADIPRNGHVRDPLEEPDAFTVEALYRGVESILSRCPSVRTAGNVIELTPSVIRKLKAEIGKISTIVEIIITD